jgi:hypothetical protein
MSSPKGHSKACENAKHFTCKCKCKKKFHGLWRKSLQESELKEEHTNPNELIGTPEKPMAVFNQEKIHAYTLEEIF